MFHCVNNARRSRLSTKCEEVPLVIYQPRKPVRWLRSSVAAPAALQHSPQRGLGLDFTSEVPTLYGAAMTAAITAAKTRVDPASWGAHQPGIGG